jgi:dihydrofolate reductase
MRQLRYGVAMSLDGFIAGYNGEYDWIVMDPDIDFDAMFARYDTLLMGRKTFATMQAMGNGDGSTPGQRTVVVSSTLRQEDHPQVTIVTDAIATAIELKAQEGKDVWLFGGGELFQALLEAKLVDALEVAIIPVLVGGGIPLLPPPAPRTSLALKSHRLYEKSGIMMLEYDIVYAS